jgi:hypothetical protein
MVTHLRLYPPIFHATAQRRSWSCQGPLENGRGGVALTSAATDVCFRKVAVFRVLRATVARLETLTLLLPQTPHWPWHSAAPSSLALALRCSFLKPRIGLGTQAFERREAQGRFKID